MLGALNSLNRTPNLEEVLDKASQGTLVETYYTVYTDNEESFPAIVEVYDSDEDGCEDIRLLYEITEQDGEKSLVRLRGCAQDINNNHSYDRNESIFWR